jgi:nucleolar protein 14
MVDIKFVASVYVRLITIEAAAEQYASIPSFYELFAPMISTLTRLKKKFAVGGSQMAASMRAIQMHVNASLKSRRPLQLQTFAPAVLPSLAPRFEENYAMRKDKTADRDKAQLKQLQRQVKRERKGASRELRLDAAYVARQRMEEHAMWKKEKDEKQREIRAWLQEQNATFNQQVRKGGELLKGGGAGAAKKRRVSKNN